MWRIFFFQSWNCLNIETKKFSMKNIIVIVTYLFNESGLFPLHVPSPQEDQKKLSKNLDHANKRKCVCICMYVCVCVCVCTWQPTWAIYYSTQYVLMVKKRGVNTFDLNCKHLIKTKLSSVVSVPPSFPSPPWLEGLDLFKAHMQKFVDSYRCKQTGKNVIQ